MEAAEEVAGALENEIVEQQQQEYPAVDQEQAEPPADQKTEQVVAPSETKVERAHQETLNIADYRSAQHVADIGRECTALHHVFGADALRKSNMSLIEHDTLVYATSAAVVFQNVTTAAKEYLLSVGDNGIGCVAVHPSRKIFAVGGKGFQPSIYIYSYPGKKLLKVLAGGAERGYSCMNFSPDGAKLASVSTSPDFMLTIWDWEQEQMGLHAKAFGQDVYNVAFSQDDPGRLTTSGVGHIRFWKIASTFTGLKLQGSIGKFGKIDLSDIDTFVELPDGKVVSSTETGALLLWEGHFIKCRLTRNDGQPCHDGAVTFLGLDRAEKRVISASVDGYIRWWSFAKIDNAEVDSDHSMDFDLEPVAELYLGDRVGVKSMLDSGSDATRRLLVVQDTLGRMLSFNFAVHDKQKATPVLNLCGTVQSLTQTSASRLASEESQEFVVDEKERFYIDKHVFEDFHASGLTGLDTCPQDHLVATCSADGTVRCFDYARRQMVAIRKFGAPATCLKWLPRQLDPSGRMAAVGFGDGVVRVLAIGEDPNRDRESLNAVKYTFLRKLAFKPHNAPVTDLAFSGDGGLLATSGGDGIVFFFQCNPVMTPNVTWNPVRFVTIAPDAPVGNNRGPTSCRQINWSPDTRTMLCTCTDGVLREVDLSTIQELVAEAAQGGEVVTYEVQFPIREVVVRVPLPPVPAPLGKTASTATIAAPKGSDAGSVVSSPVKGESAATLTSAGSVGGMSGTETRPGTADTAATANTVPLVPAYSTVPAKINAAIYTIKRDVTGALTAATLGQKNYTLEGDPHEECPIREIPNGLYTTDGKDQLKNPLPSTFRYSHTKNFLLSGLTDGAVVIRPSEYLEVFVRAPAHSGVGHGAALLAMSFDDRYVLSGGSDGTLVVRKVRLDLIEARARGLYQDVDAGVFGNTLIKPEPLTATVEPNYLTYASTLIDTAERALFELGGTMMTTVSVLRALQAEAEERDIAAGTYSIQDNRLKAEEDARKVAAEELKQRVRASIQALRKDYKNILRENESLPEVARLSTDELTVDREYLDLLAEEGDRMVEEVHRECEYEAEKAEALLQKVSTRLMDGLLMEEITLSAFNPPRGKRVPKSAVRSFRARSLDPSIDNILVEVHKMVRANELREAQLRINETAQRKANEAMDQLMAHLHNREEDADAAAEAAAALAQLDLKGTHTRTATELAAEVTAAESSVAARRQKRLERKEALRKHLSEKPNEDEDDIRDVNAIRIAEKTIGDYKLKCADDYEVPEEQRSNAAKKLRQMALLEESMLSMRLQFNERFLALRNLKREIIFAVRRDNKRIREIDAELEQSEKSRALWEPTFDPDEFPDDADEVTEAELAQFEKDRRTLPWEKVKPPKHVVITGSKTEITKNSKTGTYEAVLRTRASQYAGANPLENILSDAKLADETPARTDPPRYYEVNPSILKAYITDPLSADAQRLVQLEHKIPALRRIHDAMHTRMHLPVKSEVQFKAVTEARARLEFERSMILTKMDENIAMFAEAVDDLRTDRHAITADLKLAELKLLVLFQEYQLLLTFEGRDNALQQKQLKCKAEETEIKSLTNENRSKLEAKEDELQNWVEKLSLISTEFKTMLPDSHPYCETLTKIFKKKIKRSKGRDDGEDEDDYESDNGDEDDDDEDEEEVEDICPPGCDQALFEKILDLREKKLDTEEVSADIQKGIEDLKRTIDRLRAREKQIVKDAHQTELEVQQFQLQKQAALNQIAVVVPLRISQLFMFNTSGSLTGPTDRPVADGEDSLEAKQNVERLRDATQRSLVTDIGLKTHTLFSDRNLQRLKQRIDELHVEIDAAKEDFRHLHRERGQLTRERDAQQQEIEVWSARCRELQMLKFGRVIDLDELEANSDRSKEREAEDQLVSDAEKFKAKSQKLFAISAKLQEQLTEVTKRNTKLLNEVAELSESQQKISKELNAPGQVVAHTSKLDNFREIEEQKRIAAYIKFQATELESLRTELNMLKRKEAPPVLIPSPPAASRGPNDLVLPPIPGAKRIQS